MMCIRLPSICFCSALLLLLALQASAQQASVTRYVYDNNGRLRAVLAPNGEAAVYDYDLAGNFTAIRRLGANGCEALEFTPQQGTTGALVTIYGVGFGGQVRGVSFNGVAAQIVSQTPISVVARVPAQATTGPIAVTLPCGVKTFATPFTISGVQVTPSAITLFPGRSVQFLANVMGIVDPAVEWSVNGVKGGNTAVGIITGNGFYLAPALPTGSSSAQFTVRATSVIEATLFGEAQVKVSASGYEFLSQGVAVRYGTPVNNAVAYVAGPVSVRYGEPPKNGLAYVAAPVSARFEPPPARGSVSAINSVSVTRSASVAAISENSFARGQTVTLTLRGNNLSEITALRLVNADGSEEANIIVSELKVEADGARLTVKLSVQRATKPGRRALRLLTADGALPLLPTKIEIVP